MHKLLPYYERELATLRRDSAEFASRYPAIADKLRLAGDGARDPGVEQMVQAFSLLTARIAKRLDDDYPKFTESLLESMYPHYLRPFPACSIAHIDNDHATGTQRDAVIVVPRKTMLRSAAVQGVACQFRTVYDVIISPLRVSTARFNTRIDAPRYVRLPQGVTSCLEITVYPSAILADEAPPLSRLRLFVDAEAALSGAVRDALFINASTAYVSGPHDMQWRELGQLPISPVGFQEEEALIPYSERSHPAYRLLTEYFAFPDKFNFIDIDLKAIAAVQPLWRQGFTLHLGLRNVPGDSAPARILTELSSTHLKTHCTPIVNLFARHAAPVNVTHRLADYELLADTARPQAYEIYSLESASLISDGASAPAATSLRPFYGPGHGQGEETGYWLTRRDEMVANSAPGHEVRIVLVDADLAPLSLAARVLAAELTCTNRDLPRDVPTGAPEGDLHASGVFDDTPIRLLRKPTASLRFENGEGAHWRLISHLTLNHRSLTDLGVEEFRQMLTLYDLPRSPVTQRQIRGVVGLGYKSVMTWISDSENRALMPGIEVRLTLDEDAFVGGALSTFCLTIDHFFALYGQINVFTQLVVVSRNTGLELLRCRHRSGRHTLT